MHAKAKLSKTKIKSRIRKKTNPELAATISSAAKNPSWLKLAKLLSISTRLHSSLNLSDIDAKTATGDTVLVPGKVLSGGDITKKIKICSFGISAPAKEKLKKTKSEWVPILDEIKKNQKAEGLKILK